MTGNENRFMMLDYSKQGLYYNEIKGVKVRMLGRQNDINFGYYRLDLFSILFVFYVVCVNQIKLLLLNIFLG